MVKLKNVIFGAVSSYYFQVKVDILTSFTFGSSLDDEVLGMDVFCLEVGALERTCCQAHPRGQGCLPTRSVRHR